MASNKFYYDPVVGTIQATTLYSLAFILWLNLYDFKLLVIIIYIPRSNN